MNAKEKAIELVDKFDRTYWSYEQAKELALICCDEMIAEVKWWHDTTSYEIPEERIAGENKVEWWLQVRKEIERI